MRQTVGARWDMAPVNVKEDARQLVEGLPDNVTWEDLMYKIYVRQAIERGMEDSRAGRTIDASELRARFGLPK